MEIRLNYLEKLVKKASTSYFNLKPVELHNETLAIKNEIIRFIQSEHPNKERKRVVSCCINQLVACINQINYSISGYKGAFSSNHLTLVSELRNMILYIESVATKWFNYSIYIPAIMHKELSDACTDIENEIKPRMTKLKISSKLIYIALKPFSNHYCSSSHTKFNRYFYILSYYEHLRRLICHTDFLINPQKELVRLLIEVNLNSDYFKRYAIYYIDDRVKQCASEKEKIKALYSLSGFLNEIIPYNGMTYNYSKPHIYEYIKNIISNKIKHHKKLNGNQNPMGVEEPLQTYIKKLTTTLKVSQLGVLCRLIFDEKMIIDTSCSELVNLASSIFQAENSKEISAQNLRNNFYSPDEKTVKEVQKLLKELLMQSNNLTYNLNYNRLQEKK